MLKNKFVFTKKRALSLILIFALLLVGLAIFSWHSSKEDSLSTPQGRQMFLASLGWDISLDSEEAKSVIIPEKFEGVMEDYNKMQQEQGLDLSLYAGQSCTQYTYSLLNYPGQAENVYLSIYLKDSKLIGADIHTNSINGFMQGIFPSEQ